MTITSCRIDKWLWAVRIFRTRSLAKEACTKGNVRLNATVAKASSQVKSGDKIAVKLKARSLDLVVLDVLEKRVGASSVVDYCLDVSPPERTQPALPASRTTALRDRGAGRPTKRDRRNIDKLRGR